MTEHKNRDFYRWTRDKQKAFEEQVKEANDTKFPRSGGTITGPIVIDIPPRKVHPEIPITFKVQYSEAGNGYEWNIALSSVGDLFYIQYRKTNLLAMCSSLGLFSAYPQNKSFTLGYHNAPWPNVYTKKLNNGADLELPTKAGTIALLSDIEDILKKYNLIPETKE